MTSLMFLASNTNLTNHFDTFKILVEAGADCFLKDTKGLTAFDSF
jgi:hypothetical protein